MNRKRKKFLAGHAAIQQDPAEGDNFGLDFLPYGYIFECLTNGNLLVKHGNLTLA